jgi:hypothetical protein
MKRTIGMDIEQVAQLATLADFTPAGSCHFVSPFCADALRYSMRRNVKFINFRSSAYF